MLRRDVMSKLVSILRIILSKFKKAGEQKEDAGPFNYPLF